MKNEQSKVIQHANLASWIIDFISKEDIFQKQKAILDPKDSIKKFYKVSSKIKSDYLWETASDEAFKKKFDSFKNPTVIDSNRFYWKYLLKQFEAFQILTIWRGEELLSNSIRLINIKEYLPSAIIARSLLELAVKFSVFCNISRGTFKSIIDSNIDYKTKVVASTEFEKIIAGVTFSDKRSKEAWLKPDGVMNDIDLIDKAYKKMGIKEKIIRNLYADLCEIAHPNALGYFRYIKDNPLIDPHGFTKFHIDKKNKTGTWLQEIIRTTLASLAWSSESMSDAHLATNDIKYAFAKKLFSNL